MVAATGYTGEETGFEVYVHPSRCAELWNKLLDEGRALGVRPAGLGRPALAGYAAHRQ